MPKRLYGYIPLYLLAKKKKGELSFSLSHISNKSYYLQSQIKYQRPTKWISYTSYFNLNVIYYKQPNYPTIICLHIHKTHWFQLIHHSIKPSIYIFHQCVPYVDRLVKSKPRIITLLIWSHNDYIMHVGPPWNLIWSAIKSHFFIIQESFSHVSKLCIIYQWTFN